jgi:hypothetical protein
MITYILAAGKSMWNTLTDQIFMELMCNVRIPTLELFCLSEHFGATTNWLCLVGMGPQCYASAGGTALLPPISASLSFTA